MNAEMMDYPLSGTEQLANNLEKIKLDSYLIPK